jgi:hypothetical protein
MPGDLLEFRPDVGRLQILSGHSDSILEIPLERIMFHRPGGISSRVIRSSIVCATLGAAASLACAQTPIGQWRFDGNTDNTGSGGSLLNLNKNTPQFFAPGIIAGGQGIVFDGCCNQSLTPVLPSLFDSPQGFTVTGFIRINAWSPTGSIINIRNPVNTTGFALEPAFGTSDSMLFAVAATGSFGYTLGYSPGWQVGKDYFIAASYSATSGRMRVYRDGVLVLEQAVPGLSFDFDPSWQVKFGQNIVNGNVFNGLMDNFAYYTQELTPLEVECAMKEGIVSQQPSNTTACPGTSTSLSVKTRGSAFASYQWHRNSVAISLSENPTARSAQLVISNPGPADAGQYRCVITNACGQEFSTLDAVLTLRDCPYGACVADYDGSGGTPDTADISEFFNAWLAGDDCADADCSGGTPDGSDIGAFFTVWLAGGC